MSQKYIDLFLYFQIIDDIPIQGNNITRFTIHLDDEIVDMDILHPQDDYTFIEFSQINWKYGGKKYR